MAINGDASKGQLGAVAKKYGTTPRTGAADLPDPEKPDANGVTRAGRSYDAYTTQAANPNAPLGAAPQWNANAGPYGAYLNRLNTSGQAAQTPLQKEARYQTLQALGAGPTANQSLATAQGDQAQIRAQQLAASQRLGNAGAANAATQQGLAAWGSGQASGDSQLQGAAAQGAAGADVGSAGYQNQALGMFADAAAGRGPSAAQAMLRQATANNVATQRALAAGARGGGAAAAMRQANQAGVQLGLQSQAQAAALRAQEQQAGMAGLAGAAAQARAGDISRYGLGADILNQKRAADMGAVGTIGGLASQGRAQDIGQAGITADYLSGVRSQDIGAGAALGGVENQNLAINNAQQLGAIDAAARMEQLRQSGIAGANETNLNAANLMSGNYLQGRNISLQHDAAQDSLGAQYLGATFGGVGGLTQGFAPYLAPNPGGGYPTANSADWLARRQAGLV